MDRYWKKFTSQDGYVIQRIRFSLDVFTRCKPGKIPELMDEMGLVIEPVPQGDLAPVGEGFPFELQDRLLEAHDLHIVLGCCAYMRFEQADEMLLRVPDLFADPLEADTRLAHDGRQGKVHAA